jgi:putative restriction endonuclease
MSQNIRTYILAELAKHTGRRVPWQFIKHTTRYIPQIERFHNLITGIFKPAWSDYALSIVIRTASPYDAKDEIVFLDDGRWLMTYSPRAGGLQIADNRALIKCMDDRVPLGVFRQLTDKNDKKLGSTYRVLGLGLVTAYDANQDVFIVESPDHSALESITNTISDESIRYEVQLYAQVMNSFQPFVKEESFTYTTTMPKRDIAFREIVVREYDFTCSVCNMKFRWQGFTEATAAHIIPKHKNGTDDPRNGLSLCRTHHWAFDQGVFSLSDNYEILLSPSVESSESHNFTLLEMEGKPVHLPLNETLFPHPEAIKWHRENILVASSYPSNILY